MTGAIRGFWAGGALWRAVPEVGAFVATLPCGQRAYVQKRGRHEAVWGVGRLYGTAEGEPVLALCARLAREAKARAAGRAA